MDTDNTLDKEISDAEPDSLRITINRRKVTFQKDPEGVWSAQHTVSAALAALSSVEEHAEADSFLKRVEMLLYGLNTGIIRLSEISKVSKLLGRSMSSKDSALDAEENVPWQIQIPNRYRTTSYSYGYGVAFKTNCILRRFPDRGASVMHLESAYYKIPEDPSSLRWHAETDHIYSDDELKLVDQRVLLEHLEECTRTIATYMWTKALPSLQSIFVFGNRLFEVPAPHGEAAGTAFWWKLRSHNEILYDLAVLTDLLTRQDPRCLVQDDVMKWFPHQILACGIYLSKESYTGIPGQDFLARLFQLFSNVVRDKTIFSRWIKAVMADKRIMANPFITNWIRLLCAQYSMELWHPRYNHEAKLLNPRESYDILMLIASDWENMLNYHPDMEDEEKQRFRGGETQSGHYQKVSINTMQSDWLGIARELLEMKQGALYNTSTSRPLQFSPLTGYALSRRLSDLSYKEAEWLLKDSDPDVLPGYRDSDWIYSDDCG